MDLFFIVTTLLSLLMGANQQTTASQEYAQQQLEQEIQSLTSTLTGDEDEQASNNEGIFEDALTDASQSPLEFIGSMTKQIEANKNKLIKNNKALDKQEKKITKELNQLKEQKNMYYYDGMWHLVPQHKCGMFTEIHKHYANLLNKPHKEFNRKETSIWVKDMTQKMTSAKRKRMMAEKDLNPMIKSIWKGTKSPISILNSENTGMKNSKELTEPTKHIVVNKH